MLPCYVSERKGCDSARGGERRTFADTHAPRIVPCLRDGHAGGGWARIDPTQKSGDEKHRVAGLGTHTNVRVGCESEHRELGQRLKVKGGIWRMGHRQGAGQQERDDATHRGQSELGYRDVCDVSSTHWKAF